LRLSQGQLDGMLGSVVPPERGAAAAKNFEGFDASSERAADKQALSTYGLPDAQGFGAIVRPKPDICRSPLDEVELS
jgi:hypothetical protein